MPKEIGLPKYFKYSELKGGEKLVKMGEFIGSSEGRFGAQHNFVQLEDGQHVVLNKAGGLDWRIEQGHVVEGGVYDVTYAGKDVLTKGKFEGKEAHKFSIAQYDDEELEEAGVKKSNRRIGAESAETTAAETAPAAKPQKPSKPVKTTSLDELE